jgi:hypothetical protein
MEFLVSCNVAHDARPRPLNAFPQAQQLSNKQHTAMRLQLQQSHSINQTKCYTYGQGAHKAYASHSLILQNM